VMGWSTSVISPPSGNMEAYMNSLELVLQRDDTSFWPAHGPGIDDPKSFVRSFITHRLEREQEILNQLKKGFDTVQKMVPHIYKDVAEFLYPAAERSTLAAVIYMRKKGLVHCYGKASVSSKITLI
ncbi:MAG: MBL fold metallo-hydrolase, partial [SAR324 cluster bacterium]|nr:MBL fold metallo-hydrolase [SAR324 cluster bacterium]